MEGVQTSAIRIISRAIEHEQEKRFQPALTCYEEGIDLLLIVLKCRNISGSFSKSRIIRWNFTACTDHEKKKIFREKLSEYITRAEQIKDTIQKQKQEGKYHEQIHVQVTENLTKERGCKIWSCKRWLLIENGRSMSHVENLISTSLNCNTPRLVFWIHNHSILHRGLLIHSILPKHIMKIQPSTCTLPSTSSPGTISI